MLFLAEGEDALPSEWLPVGGKLCLLILLLSAVLLGLGSATLSSSKSLPSALLDKNLCTGLATGDLGAEVGCGSVLCCLKFLADLQLRPELPLLCEELMLLIGNPILEGGQASAEPASLGTAGRIQDMPWSIYSQRKSSCSVLLQGKEG